MEPLSCSVPLYFNKKSIPSFIGYKMASKMILNGFVRNEAGPTTQLVSLANLNNHSAAENAEIVRIPNFEPARMHGHGLLQSVPWQSGRPECAKL